MPIRLRPKIVQGAVNAFSTFQPDFGTSPVADSSADTLTLTSTDNSVTITGDASTDTIDFSANTSSMDHGNLNGLGDDDHTQYHNDTRGDARYYQKTEFINTSAGAGDSGKPVVLDAGGQIDDTMINDGDIDHTQIANIGTNSHAQIDTHIADTANPHATDIGNLGSGTLAELNAIVTDATLDDSGDSRPPTGAAGGDLGGTYPNPTVNDGADSTAIHDNIASEISAITLKATPTSADFLVIEDAADSNNKKSVTIGSLPAPAPIIGTASATDTVDTSTTSATYVVITGMTVTPASGTYLVSFSASGSVSTGNADVNYAIFSDGTIVAHSERNFMFSGGGAGSDMEGTWHTQAFITVNGAQAIDVRWLTSAGTVTARERSLLMIRTGT